MKTPRVTAISIQIPLLTISIQIPLLTVALSEDEILADLNHGR